MIGERESPGRSTPNPHRRSGGAALALLAAVLLSGLPGVTVAAEETEDSCVTCHRDPAFLVTNKKLYDYYRQWEGSIHRQEGVTCDECHGGRPDAPDKETAHAGGLGASNPTSGVNFRHIADTCGQCHEDILEGFRTSNHFEYQVKKDEKQGPTCVTCHGSINVEVLNVSSVEAACSRCHNRETDNHPEIPAKARSVLNQFLSIHRFYRYIAVHAEPGEAQAFFAGFDPRLEKLSVTWHTFDLDKIDQGTAEALALLKAKRDELRRRHPPAARPPTPEKAGAQGP